MEKIKPNRQQAYSLLNEYNKSESLIKHALSVEAVMLHFCELFQEEDKEKWGIVGLMHDLDYEMYPENHCIKVKEILTENNWPEDYIRAIQSHGWGICTDIEPMEKMEKVLYATDELTGLINATAIMRPSKSILDLEKKSVKKKFKDKGFAAGVNREVIENGAKMLNMDIDTLITETINGMKKSAKEIGLEGNIATQTI